MWITGTIRPHIPFRLYLRGIDSYVFPMKHHRLVDSLIAEALKNNCCVYGESHAVRSALRRRARAGELRRVMPNMYAPCEYWTSLKQPERSLHVVRTLHKRHPQWIFAGVTAATVHGFEHQWSLHDGTVTIVSRTSGAMVGRGAVRRLYGPDAAVEVAGGIPVTVRARTVADCALLLDFRHALPIADSALRMGVPACDILDICRDAHHDCTPIFRVLTHADPRSDNGGESFARGTILDSSLAIPDIQVPFTDPLTGRSYRADFAWRLSNGTFIVAEFDGTDKYVDPSMTDGKSVRRVVQDEREREDALRRANVSNIVRFTFDDVIRRGPLLNKLIAADVPTRTT